MSDAAKLLPCPFCGAGAHIYENEVDYVAKWSAGCNDCNADFDACEDTPAEAAAAWNTRASLPRESELRRAVIEECAQAAMSAVGMIPMGQVDASEFCDTIQDEIVASIRALSSEGQEKKSQSSEYRWPGDNKTQSERLALHEGERGAVAEQLARDIVQYCLGNDILTQHGMKGLRDRLAIAIPSDISLIYGAMLARAGELIAKAEPGTKEGRELDILVAAVQAYEDRHYPFPPAGLNSPPAANEGEREKESQAKEPEASVGVAQGAPHEVRVGEVARTTTVVVGDTSAEGTLINRLERILEQAQDCIKGETPEDVSHEEAREDTVSKIREGIFEVIPALRSPPASGGLEAALRKLINAIKTYQFSPADSPEQSMAAADLDDAVDEARTALRFPPVSADWQPRDTIPRDGSVILCYWGPAVPGGARAIDLACWVYGQWCDADDASAHFGEPDLWKPLDWPGLPAAPDTEGR